MSLISLTYDDSTRPAPAPVARRQPRRADSLLARVAQKDSRAVRECIDQFGGLVWSIARRLTRTHADAEAAVQEIFTDVWRSAERFDPAQGSERVFVAMIARRRLIDRMRRGRHAGSTSDIDPLGWSHPSDVSAEAQAAARAVMRLRPELREVLELGVLQGLTQPEIADVLQLPLDTVKNLMRLGLMRVRELMGNPGAGSNGARR